MLLGALLTSPFNKPLDSLLGKKMSQIKHIFPDGLLARLYPFEMARKYNNPGNLSIHNVFKLSSLDCDMRKTPV
jgi:hypothetical protein